MDQQNNYESQNKQLVSQEILRKGFTSIIDRHPDLEFEDAFNLQYCKLYISNIQLQNQVTKTKLQIDQIRNNSMKKAIVLAKIRAKVDLVSAQKSYGSQNDDSSHEKKKRQRRTANQIARHYTCPHEKCSKSYGSQGSLNQHIKLKHGDIPQFFRIN